MDNTPGKKYGIIAGVGLVLYFLLFYVIDKALMLDVTVSWLSLLIVVACVFMAVNEQRKANGEIITFKEGLKTGFLVIVLSNLIYYAFFFFLMKTDPELVTIFKQKGIAFYKSILPETEWEAMEKSYENFTYGFFDLLQYFSKSTIGGFFIALLAAFLLKRSTARA